MSILTDTYTPGHTPEAAVRYASITGDKLHAIINDSTPFDYMSALCMGEPDERINEAPLVAFMIDDEGDIESVTWRAAEDHLEHLVRSLNRMNCASWAIYKRLTGGSYGLYLVSND